MHPLGFEPKTFGFGGQHSIQLSYGCFLKGDINLLVELSRFLHDRLFLKKGKEFYRRDCWRKARGLVPTIILKFFDRQKILEARYTLTEQLAKENLLDEKYLHWEGVRKPD